MPRKLKNKNGFIALITAILLSAAAMAVALGGSSQMAAIFDEITRKEYRYQATQGALACLDDVFVELSHDYFYSTASSSDASDPISASGISYADQHCSIVSVIAISSSTMPSLPLGALKSVVVTGFAADPRYNITSTITAQVLLNDENISLLSEKVKF